jgi:hypothetical protein
MTVKLSSHPSKAYYEAIEQLGWLQVECALSFCHILLAEWIELCNGSRNTASRATGSRGDATAPKNKASSQYHN